MADSGFAGVLAAATDPEQFLAAEDRAGHAHRFTDVDRLAADLLAAALAGRQIATITRAGPGEKTGDILTLKPLHEQQRTFMHEALALPAQEKRGAWFLPEHATLKLATTNLSAYLRQRPAYALTLASEDTVRVQLNSTPDALAAWALIVHLFDILMAPITERATGSVKPPDEQITTWTSITTDYERLGIRADDELSVFVYRGGWAHLNRGGHTRARLALLDALARHDPNQIVTRARAVRVHALIAALVNKSRTGTPLARRVLTKRLQPVVAAYFAGDWLALLDYLEMPVNPSEDIITTLPEPKLYVGGAAKAPAVAAEHGIAVDEVHAILAAFMGQNTSESPIEQRLRVLNRWWEQFDIIHARQTPGMPTLWGLVEEGHHTPSLAAEESSATRGPIPLLYQRLMTADLVNDVNRLWDGLTLPRWPETVVSEPYPHRLMAETFGPAIDFWHGVALTAWYVCRGPYSRTTLSGLSEYHQRHLNSLASVGTPIHLSLFDELNQAENYLGPPQDLATQIHEISVNDGLHIALKFSGGGRHRDGFEILRDIITRHRRGWTGRYLNEYLKSRWNSELTAVARQLHRHVAAKGKVPTFRQFARFATTAANHWFNGDLAGLYTAIGEKAPETQRRVDLLPGTAHDFVDAVYIALGGQPVDDQLPMTNPTAAERMWRLSTLASASIRYLQISEAIGRPPSAVEFSASRYEWPWPGGLDEGWPIYQRTMERLRLPFGE